jgi:hypothetical protein
MLTNRQKIAAKINQPMIGVSLRSVRVINTVPSSLVSQVFGVADLGIPDKTWENMQDESCNKSFAFEQRMSRHSIMVAKRRAVS